MANKEVIKKLKMINEINPDKRWVKKNRSDLLCQIQETCPAVNQSVWNKIFSWMKLNFGFFLDAIFPKSFVDNFARPLAVSFVGAIIVAGSMTTVGMSQNTIPGDILYPVKIVGENVQLALTSNVESKARTEMEFAGRRIEELNKLVAENKINPSNMEEKINKVTAKLQKNIQTVNIHLAELNKTGETKSVLKVASDIDRRVSEYTVALNNISKTTASQAKVAEALNQVEEVSDKALEVIVSKHKDPEDGISDLEIAEKLNSKIALAIGDTETGEDSKIQNEELDKTIQDARDLIQTGDFAAALNKITEGKDIIKDIRAKMDAEAQEQEINETQKQDGIEEAGDEEVLESDEVDAEVEDLEIDEAEEEEGREGVEDQGDDAEGEEDKVAEKAEDEE